MPRYLTTLLFSLSLVINFGIFVPVTSAQATDDTFVGPPAAPSATDLKDVPDISMTAPPPGVPMSEGVASVMSSIMTLFAWLLGVAVITLDNAVYYTVVKMGSVVNGLSAIGVAWRILRDVANIALIFGFLAIGISTILGSDLYGWSKNLLPKLLMAAVFLNFSLFITEAVIDTGNLFATQFYMQINGGQPAGVKDISVSAVQNDGIASKIMNQLGLQAIYGDATTNSYLFEGGSSLIIGFMSIILFLVTAFVMFSLAFILIARFVILVLVIVFAPLGFAGYAVPKLEGLAKQWSGMLIQQTITAPILLLALYVALAVITDAQFLTGFGATQAGAWTSWVEGGNLTNFAGVLLSFIVAIGLLLAVTVISKKLSTWGGETAIKWGGRAAFGTSAMLGSLAIGGSAYGLRRGIQRYAPNAPGARVASRALRYVEGMKMDVRSLPGVGAGLRFGGAGESATSVDRSTVARGQQAWNWYNTGGTPANRAFDQETRIPRLLGAINAGDAQLIGQLFGSMSNQELENPQVRRMLINSPLAAALLPQNRFDALMQSENLTENEKNQIRAARGRDPRFNAANATANIGAMTTDQRSQLNGNVLTQPHVMPLLDASDFNAIQRRGQLTPAQRAVMGTHILNILTTPGAPSPIAANLAIAAAAPAFRNYYNLP